MTPAQNRALRSVILNHLRHLDRFQIYLETAPGISLVDSIYEGILRDLSYQRATLRGAIEQLEDQYNASNPDINRDRRAGFPTGTSSTVRSKI